MSPGSPDLVSTFTPGSLPWGNLDGRNWLGSAHMSNKEKRGHGGPGVAGGEGVEASIHTAMLLVLYASGACPTIYVGDSGELVTAVHTLGIPHPSGYPLYVLLGKVWTLVVRTGSVAGSMSLFSVACAAAAAGLLHRSGRRMGLRPVAAATAALLLAVSPSFWGEANIQRVYSLNALFVVLVLSAVISWYRSGQDRWLYLAFFWCGLGATNHTFMAIEAAALAVFVGVRQPRILGRPKTLLASAGAFGVGLLPYLYLPIRSRMNPVLDWGNPETFSGFANVILRREYWDRAWIEGHWDAVWIAADYLRSLGEELLWVGAVLAAVGVIAGFRRGWPVLFPLLVMAGNLFAVGLHGSRSDIFIWHRYYIPSYIMAALLAGIGCDVILQRLPRRLRFLPLAVPALGLLVGWPDFDRSRYRIAEDYSSKLLRTLPPDASLAATDDNVLFPLMYLHWVEEARPDVNLILQGVGDADLPPLRFNPDEDPVFFTHHPNWQIQGLDMVPVGLVFRAVRSGSPAPAIVPQAELAGAHDPRVPKDYLTQNLIGHYHFMLGTTFERFDSLRALEELDEAGKAAPQNDVLFYNLGLVYARNGLYDEARAAFERSHAINPRRLQATGDVSAAQRLAQLQTEVERIRRIEAELSGDLPPTGSFDRYQLLAERLQARGEIAAARGHRVRALRLAGDES